jgi:hypothetical protein
MANATIEKWLRRNWQPTAEAKRYDALQPMTVVTGGSEGLGLELARNFAQVGNPVLIVARSDERLKAVAQELGRTLPVKVHTLSADLTTSIGLASIRRTLAELDGYCDVLVNNAGVGTSGPLHETPPEALRQALDLNARAVTELTREMLPGMLTRGRGGIVNVASLAGYLPGPYQAIYYASKAYVVSLTEAVAHEVAGQGVRVCVLAPGPIATGIHAKMGSERAYYTALTALSSTRSVARSAYRGYCWGQTVIVPGLFHKVFGLVLRLTPHPLLVPIAGWLLRRRN